VNYNLDVEFLRTNAYANNMEVATHDYEISVFDSYYNIVEHCIFCMRIFIPIER